MVNSSNRLTPVHLVERDVVLKRTCNCHQQSYMRRTAVLILIFDWVQIILYGYRSFRYKFFSRVVNIVSRRPWLKERRIFTQNVFLVHAQTILEVNEIFVQFHCLSSYRNNLYQNNQFPRIHLLQGNVLLPTIQLDEGGRLVPKQ